MFANSQFSVIQSVTSHAIAVNFSEKLAWGCVQSSSTERHAKPSQAKLIAGIAMFLFLVLMNTASGQLAPRNSTPSELDQWKARSEDPRSSSPTNLFRRTPEVGSNTTLANDPLRPISQSTIPVSTGGLPKTHGQVWRVYDISAYTLRVTSTKRPEQALVDWILRETGYETWHSEVVSVLAADQRSLRVYHTEAVQEVVKALVDRFVSEKTGSQSFGLRIITVGSPNWRLRANRLLRPVSVESPGAQGWLVRREDLAILLAELQNRTDFREHSTPHLMISNGQTFTNVATRPTHFNQNVLLTPGAAVAPQFGQIEEGFSLEFSPLMAMDQQTVDAVLKINMTQLEKLHSIYVDNPSVATGRQRTRVETPQVVQYKFSERFRWPVDQVLVVSLGMVPNPLPKEQSGWNILGFSNTRCDFLVFIDSKGNVDPKANDPKVSNRSGTTYHGRY